MSGKTSYHAGVAAEDIVAKDYLRRGRIIAERRWRGKGGEVDLIVREGARVVFVEVKKSSSFTRAATRLSRKQMDRLCAAATEFVSNEPDGQLTDMRFDLAMVDSSGAVRIIENAFMEA
ncbi:putative endonuclease [Cognatiyoonia koreensis]|uniref:UPF0102 protein SAMN04488515_1990 n=1 Tax=Cognatiyoonia koreensis TaxID=364200 RepID=A0A1I0QKZ2_9RHOB|nr:YraN family protein [Cognatiyoonia koreensis]SEW27819.1 putative endonuclease [Cognatiyoonia koreensis]